MDPWIVYPFGIVMNSRMQPGYVPHSIEEGDPEVNCIFCFTHPLRASAYLANLYENDVPKDICLKWHETHQELLTSFKMLEPFLAEKEISHLLIDMVPNGFGEWRTIAEVVETLEQQNCAALN